MSKKATLGSICAILISLTRSGQNSASDIHWLRKEINQWLENLL